MKILFDPQIFHIQKFGGISTIFSELWLRMNSEPNIEIQCPIIYSENIYLKNMGLWKSNFSSLLNLNFKGSGRIKDYLFHLSRKRTISYLEKGNFDIFILTYYNPYFLEHLHGKPFILFVEHRNEFKNLSNQSNFYYQQRYNSSESEDALTVTQELNAFFEKLFPDQNHNNVISFWLHRIGLEHRRPTVISTA